MDADSPLHVYSTAAPVENSTHYTGHLVFNDEGDLVRINRKTYTHLDSLIDAHRQSLRNALVDVLVTHSARELVVHEPTLPNPGLELGRLSPDVRPRLENHTITITRHQQNNWQKLLYALVQQDTATAWHSATGSADTLTLQPPLHVYLDGSHHNKTHSTHSDESTTIGYIIVDGVGRVAATEARQLDEPTESLHAEYIALKTAVDRVAELAPAVDDVQFRTDNNNLSHTFAKGNDPPERFRFISAYIQEALDSFEHGRVIETTRDKNLFADALADIAHDRNMHYQPINRQTDIDAPGYAYTV